MKIVPSASVVWLRDEGLFPPPWKATDDQIKSVPYIAELWTDDDGKTIHVNDDQLIVISFDEISRSFDEWEQEEEDYRYENVYDYLRDCIDHGYHPCKVI